MWTQVEEEKNLTEEMVIRQGMNVPNRKVCQDVLLDCTRKAAVPITGKTRRNHEIARITAVVAVTGVCAFPQGTKLARTPPTLLKRSTSPPRYYTAVVAAGYVVRIRRTSYISTVLIVRIIFLNRHIIATGGSFLIVPRKNGVWTLRHRKRT